VIFTFTFTFKLYVVHSVSDWRVLTRLKFAGFQGCSQDGAGILTHAFTPLKTTMSPKNFSLCHCPYHCQML